jgi:general secretion pathway protein K
MGGDATLAPGGSPVAAPDAGQRGMALLIVLWIVASAALLVSAFNAIARSGASFAASEVQLSKSEALLDAGVEIAASQMLGEKETRSWLPDGRPHAVEFKGASLTISVTDPNGLVDLNQANGDLLLSLLRSFAASEAEATKVRDAILEARGEESDDSAKKPKTAAPPKAKPPAPKTTTGSAAAKPKAAKEATGEESEKPAKRSNAFIDADQFRYLPGMTLKLYRGAVPYLTVYSADGRINLVTAPNAVLAAVPNLSRIDISRVRDAAKSALKDNPALADVKQRAGSVASDEDGPAYIVTVKVASGRGGYEAARVYVIAVGLDEDAPYRLLSKKTLALAN